MAFKTVFQRVRFVTTGWTGPEMAQAGDGIIKRGLVPRIGRGLTVSDAPAPPLKEGYAKSKQRKGGKGIRDLFLSGRSMRSMKVLRAGPNTATIGFTDAISNRRIFINNRRVKQFGMSPSDTVISGEEFGKLPSPVKLIKTGSGKA